jgi:hypothetical protein
MSERQAPGGEMQRLYDQAEARAASAMEQLVNRDSFGELLARSTENLLAIAKIGSDVADLVVRNLRLAGRRDVTNLGRQLARTEDKLETVLQEVERLQDELRARDDAAGRANHGTAAARRTTGQGRARSGAGGRD